jgi:predicted thioesterase
VSKDKRKSGRVRRRIRVMLVEGNGAEHNGITTNLSATGISVDLGEVLAIGTPLTGRLFPPDIKPLAFAAEVRWAHSVDKPRNPNENHRVGLLFLGPPQNEYDALVGSRPVAQPMPVLKPATIKRPKGGTSKRPRLRPPSTGIPALRVGLEARTTHIIEPEDLAMSPLQGSASLSPSRAAAWIERAVALAIGGSLRQGMITLPLSIDVKIAPRATVAVGTCVVTHAKLVEVGAENTWLRFTATIKEGERHLASGTQLREVVEVGK